MITGKCCSIHYISREDCHTPYFNPKSLIIHWKALSEDEKTRLTIFKGQCFKEHLHSYCIKNNLCHRCYDNVFNQLRNPSDILRSLITISNKIILNYDDFHDEYLLSLLIRGDESLDIGPANTHCPNSNTIQASTEYVIDVISILYKENLDISYSIAFDKSLKMQEQLLKEINRSESSGSGKRKRKNRNKKKKVKNNNTTTSVINDNDNESENEKESEKNDKIENENEMNNKLKSNSSSSSSSSTFHNNNNPIQSEPHPPIPIPPSSSSPLLSSSTQSPSSTTSSDINKKNHPSKISHSKNTNSISDDNVVNNNNNSAATNPTPSARENSTSVDFEDDTSDSEVESFKALLQTIHQQRPSKKIEVKNSGDT